jgi:eukaryotic-like serine/threonine-protein kinase
MGSTAAQVESFLAACSACQPDWMSEEEPQHPVWLDAFWIDRTEVTNAQYQECVAAGACRVADMPSFDPEGKPTHPVVEVTWADARSYCTWAGARLPTEAEWEKAARGTDARLYPWGNEPPDCKRANYWGKEGGCVGTTAPVGSYPTGASPYGALDMAGNALEWVADWYGQDYYSASPDRNPTGPDSGPGRVLRGLGWGPSPVGPHVAIRIYTDPAKRGNSIGFRCVVPGS